MIWLETENGGSRKLLVTLVTGRTIEQGVSKERGKASKDYADCVAVCYVDPEDLKRLKIKEKTSVQVSTQFGAITLTALKSKRGPHQGLVFVPYGPWANSVVDPETDGIGMPSLKGIPAEIEPAPEKSVISLSMLLEKQFGKETGANC